MPKLTDYELQREQKIAANRRLLESLGLTDLNNLIPTRAPSTKPDSKLKAKPELQKKRKARTDVVDENDENGVDVPKKSARTNDAENGPVRRSQRNAGKEIDYKKIENARGVGQDRSARKYRAAASADDMVGDPNDASKRTQNPKQYGSIPGVHVGAWWETREACSIDAIHAPWVAGIAPGPQGAYSIALSGGYDDDVDIGYAFTFTGSGGRDLKGTKTKPKNLRTAPQSSDQSFENNFNKSLQKSAQTKRPVRVIRGYKLQSQYGPARGYRYDGLYTVERAWLEPGLNPGGFLVCKYAFKRLPGQPALPVRNISGDAQEDERGSMEAEGDSGEEDVDGENEGDEGNGEATEAASAQESDESGTEVGENGNGGVSK